MGFRIAYSDITKIEVDAIVNPTDRFFSGGGGVDRQIHDICGLALREATDRLGVLHLGEAKATEGFGLPCRYIIHTSGPRWRESHFLEISLLGSCYRNSVQLAYNLGCRSIAFPLISARGKHFPKQQALTTATNAIMECVEEYPDMDIILTIFSARADRLPEGLFGRLSEYLNETYVPGEEDYSPAVRQTCKKALSLEEAIVSEEAIISEKTERLARMECCRSVEDSEQSFIRNLLDNPTQKNLDKVEVDESFAEMLNRLIADRGIKTASILEALDISGAGLSKLRNGINNPTKLTVFALAIFFRMSIEETKDMLMKAGYAINPSSLQDIIVSGLIREGIYDRFVIDDLLYSLDLQPLPGAVVD